MPFLHILAAYARAFALAEAVAIAFAVGLICRASRVYALDGAGRAGE